jgi:Heterokaryon incompatibility protein (HET)
MSKILGLSLETCKADPMSLDRRWPTSFTRMCATRAFLSPEEFTQATGRCATCFNIESIGNFEKTKRTPREQGGAHGFAIRLAQLRQSASDGECETCHCLYAAVKPFMLTVPSRTACYFPEGKWFVIVRKGVNSGLVMLASLTFLATQCHLEHEQGDDVHQVEYCFVGNICGLCKEAKYKAMWLNLLEVQITIDKSLGAHRCKEVQDTLGWYQTPERYPLYQDRFSEESIGRIQSWMQRCVTNHAACKQSLAPNTTLLAPDHLLELGESKAPVKLVPTKGLSRSDVQYIALSYCWGPKKVGTTTKENYRSHRNGLPQDILLKTYSDLIALARRLGFKYVWIDSLCIIQYTSDFDRQTSKMGQIYREAHLVVAADSAASIDEGFLNLRETAPSHAFSLRGSSSPHTQNNTSTCGELLVIEHDWSENGHRFFTQRSVESDYLLGSSNKSVQDYNPVFTRAWCFQERLLANRILHFTKHEMVFECMCRVYCECGALPGIIEQEQHADDKSGADSESEPNLARRKNWTLKIDLSRSTARRRDMAQQHWESIVQQYTKCLLSRETDRLLALGGVAREMQLNSGITTGRYFAGLWETQLPHSLAWYSKHKSHSETAQPDTYVAPTWSWASCVQGEVSWPEDSGWRWVEPVMVSYAQILDVRCHPRSAQNPYGKLRAGDLTMRAPVLDINIRNIDPEHSSVLNPCVDSNLKYASLSYVEVKWDSEHIENWIVTNKSAGKKILLAFIDAVPGHSLVIRALVLEQMSAAGTPHSYRRLGLATLYCHQTEIWAEGFSESSREQLELGTGRIKLRKIRLDLLPESDLLADNLKAVKSARVRRGAKYSDFDSGENQVQINSWCTDWISPRKVLGMLEEIGASTRRLKIT